MDRPLGPRQPDKRLTAYESIFGRPGVSHHLSSGQSSAQNYTPPPPTYPQNQYPYPSNQQHYSPSSVDYHNSPYSSHAYLPPASSNPRQSFYAPSPPQNQSWSYPNYPYLQSQYPSHQPSLSPVSNNSLSPQPIYPPQPDDPPDPTLDPLNRQGLSPTHAYQPQPYHNNVMPHQQPQWGPRPQSILQQPQQQPLSQQPVYEYDQGLHYQNGSPSRSHPNIPIPHLNVDVDGRLGLDFDESSPSDTDADDSELPWAAHSRSCTYPPLYQPCPLT